MSDWIKNNGLLLDCVLWIVIGMSYYYAHGRLFYFGRILPVHRNIRLHSSGGGLELVTLTLCLLTFPGSVLQLLLALYCWLPRHSIGGCLLPIRCVSYLKEIGIHRLHCCLYTTPLHRSLGKHTSLVSEWILWVLGVRNSAGFLGCIQASKL